MLRIGYDLTKFQYLVRMVIVALIIVLGMGKMAFAFGGIHLEGIGLAGVAGVVLNAVLPRSRVQARAGE